MSRMPELGKYGHVGALGWQRLRATRRRSADSETSHWSGDKLLSDYIGSSGQSLTPST